jgi:hypothetical protein
LQRGGGVVVFHHGIYSWPGKEGILELLGGTANMIAWDTVDGQNVINVATDHFVASNELEYTGMLPFGDQGFGIPMAEYPFFNNTPDERYPGVQFIPATGEERTILFTSDYAGAQVLGYDLHRPDWGGHVVFYQSGEYQPNALDALDGNNFQVLANAIYFVATTQEDPVGSESSGGGEETTGDATTGGTSNASSDDVGSSGPIDETDTEGPATSGGEDGCGCRSRSGPGVPALLLLLLPAISRRARRAA